MTKEREWCGHFTITFDGVCMTCVDRKRLEDQLEEAFKAGMARGLQERDKWLFDETYAPSFEEWVDTYLGEA